MLQSSRAAYMPVILVWSRIMSCDRWGTAPREVTPRKLGVLTGGRPGMLRDPVRASWSLL